MLITKTNKIMPYKVDSKKIQSELEILAEKYENNEVKNVSKEIHKVLNICLESVDFQKLGVYSKANISSQLKKLIFTVFKDELKIKDEKLIKAIFEPYQKAKIDRQKNRIKADNLKDLPELINENEYLKTAVEMIKSDDYLLQGLGFCALTGRRSIEIFKTAKFSFLGTYEVPKESKREQYYKTILKNSKNALIFEGQVKKEFGFEKYPILILVNSKTFFANWKRFRASCLDRNFDTKTNTEVQKTIGKGLDTRAKKYFSEFWANGKTMTKDTRLAYSFLSVNQIVSNEKAKGLFYGIENRKAVYLQKTDDNILKIASTLLGHENENALSSYFLKLKNIKNI